MLAPWPEHRGLENAEADAEIGWLIRVISEVRSVRAEMNVPAGAKVPLVVSGASDETRARVARHEETMLRLARLERIEFGKPPHGAVQIVLDEAVLALPLAGIIDVDAEQKRLKREIDKVGSEIRQLDAKLGNEKFVSRAPEHVVEEQRERKTEAEATAAKLEAGAEAPRSRALAPAWARFALPTVHVGPVVHPLVQEDKAAFGAFGNPSWAILIKASSFGTVAIRSTCGRSAGGFEEIQRLRREIPALEVLLMRKVEVYLLAISHSAAEMKSSNTFCLRSLVPARCHSSPYSPPPRRLACA